MQDVDEDAPELYIAMMSNESQGALAEWTERYEEEQYAATAEMISVFVRASGCSEPVTEPMLADIEEGAGVGAEGWVNMHGTTASDAMAESEMIR